ncbi:MAG: hypothetical protein R3D55_03635 [Chloroflexota bacterium]
MSLTLKSLAIHLGLAMEIFIGLEVYVLTSYRATPGIQSLDREEKLLKESEFNHANVALWCIGKHDLLFPNSEQLAERE